MKQVHLVCNAHLDPVWQWEWDEGLAEALSTFRIAADFCDEFDGFVFNHNEAVLYQWVEQYDPALFARIQGLVAAGKWHIMGGWYLQPDCLMPAGESIARQITEGRHYFLEKFGVMPSVAMNVDSFGHDRGLAQIMAKSGYDSYLVGRPVIADCKVPDRDFLWKGYDGSRIKVHLSDEGYNTLYGHATDKIRNILERDKEKNPIMVLWGIGNHGGGPSKEDLQKISLLKEELRDSHRLIHSTPEAYFSCLTADRLPVVEKDITPVMIGCYTSQVRSKQLHRQLENLLYQTEKMAVAAEVQYGTVIDWNAIRQAEQTLRFNEFHDILPGSCVERAEQASVQSFGGALDILKKQRVKAYISMAQNYRAPRPGVMPVIVYNPHPFKVSRIVDCEFQLADQNYDRTVTDFEVYCNGKQLPSQLVKEDSNVPIDWRKRLSIQVDLEPFAMTALECLPKTLPCHPDIVQPDGERIHLENAHGAVDIDMNTGLISRYCVGGTELMHDGCRLAVIPDNEDPWSMGIRRFKDPEDSFHLATAQEAGRIAAQGQPMNPIRIIEDGDVKTVTEAIFIYKNSFAVVRYTFHKQDAQLEIDVEMMMQEPSAMVKMELPASFPAETCLGDGMFGYRTLYNNGDENAAQKWLAVCGQTHLLGLINTGTYGSSFRNGVLSQTLIRTPAYCAHPIADRQILPKGRYFSRIDTGKRSFHFVLTGGEKQQMLSQIHRQAMLIQEPPFALSFYTHGASELLPSFMSLECPTVTMTALKKSRDGSGYIIRLYHSADTTETAELKIPCWHICQTLSFGPFEVKTLKYTGSELKETSMDEIDR